MSHTNTRREFLRTTTAPARLWVAGGAMADDKPASAQSPNEKINFASIGVDGKGDSDSNDAGRSGNMVAICDVDDNKLDKAAQRFPEGEEVQRLPQDVRRDGQADRRRHRQHA